jgi:2-amino-4-hydroxy-6-hydroxymethyldihydropteridine diphosphokinase
MNDIAYVALGSNLGESFAILRQAFDQIEGLSSAPLLRSSIWRSTPVDCPPGSPDFLNAVAGLRPFPEETPESLLKELQALERTFGREPKKVLNEPRPLDLDLIAFGQQIRNRADLVLPHPRAHVRRFVLQPLAEIAPDFIFPRQEKTVSALLGDLRTDEQLERLNRSLGR